MNASLAIGKGFCLLVALSMPATGLLLAEASANGREAALSIAAALLAGLVGWLAVVRARTPAGTAPGPSRTSLTIESLSLIALAAGVLACAAAALPPDATLRSIGRPPQFLLPNTLFVSGALLAGMLGMARGADPARASLPILIPALALEGRVFGLPPSAMLLLAATALSLRLGFEARRVSVLNRPVLALLLSFATATWFAADPTPAAEVLVRLCSLGLAFQLIATDPEPIAGAKWTLGSLLASVVFVGALALTSRLELSFSLPSLSTGGTELSLFGRHPNVLAPWFAASAVLAVALAVKPTPGLRAPARVAAPMALALTVLAASRLALAAAIAGISVVLLLRASRTLRLVAGTSLALFLACALAFVPAVRGKFLDPGSLVQSADHRLHRARVGLDTFLDRPLLGQGPGCWFRQGAFTPHSRFEGLPTSDHPHTIVLAVAESAGLLGLLAFAWLVAASARAAWSAARHPDQEVRWYARAFALASATQLLTNLLDAGDAVDTVIPSRLLVDLGVLAALAAAGPRRTLLASGRAWALPAIAATAGALLFFARAANDLALEASRQERFDRARGLLEVSAALRPWHVPVRQQLVGLGFALGDPPRFREYLIEAEQLAPQQPSVHVFRARYHFQQGQMGPARAAASDALSLDPFGRTIVDTAPILAAAHAALGDTSAAAEVLAALARVEPGLLRSFAAQDGTFRVGRASIPAAEVVSRLDLALAESAPYQSRLRVFLRRAEVLEMTGLIDEALAELDQAESEREVVRIAVLYARARALLRAGRPGDALDLAGQVSAAQPQNPLAHALRADALLALSREKDAREAADRALATASDLHFYQEILHDVLVRRIRLLEVVGADEDRAEALDMLVMFEGEPRARVHALVDLAKIQADLGRPERARRALVRALRVLLRQPASDAVARELAEEIARTVAGLARPGAASHLADVWEHRAENLGGGTLVLVFRAALLEALGLHHRARLVRSWLDPGPR